MRMYSLPEFVILQSENMNSKLKLPIENVFASLKVLVCAETSDNKPARGNGLAFALLLCASY